MAPGVLKSAGLVPVIWGGGQQRGLRSGTENVPGIAAFAEAVRIGAGGINSRAVHTEALKQRILKGLECEELRGISPTLPKNHAPHILNITVPGIKSETLLHYLSSRGIFVSSGSACSSNSSHVSAALTAYGRSESEADSSVRISLSHRNTEEEVDMLIEGLKGALGSISRVKQ